MVCSCSRSSVALLAEGVDRNWQEKKEEEYHEVALLAEGVDRNLIRTNQHIEVQKSPSSRRAWIEMTTV